MKNVTYIIVFMCLTITLSSCSTAPVHVPYPIKPCELTSPISLPTYGTMHTVVAGETLWHLSKMYNVTVDDIVNDERQL